MKSQHTNGPWKADINCIWGGPHGDVYIAGTQTGIDPDTQKSNAHLIAASPELLETLKSEHEDAHVDNGGRAWCLVCKIINKAEGK